MTKKQNEGSGFFSGALIGGLLGAITALFLAPKTGKELRSDINEQATVVKGKTIELKNTAIEKGSELAELAKEKSAILTQSVSDQSLQIVDKVKQTTNAIGEKALNLKEDAIDSTETIKDEAEELLEEAESNTNDLKENVTEVINKTVSK